MKILLLDIETSPNQAFVWGLFKQNISISQIIDSSAVLCYSAKWLGENKIFFDSIMETTPKRMLQGIHSLLCEADVVVHYNGSRFDIPTLNKEFILLGLPPPNPYKQVDLLQIARNQFRFTSNKLDYVAQELGLGKKHETKFNLWVDCMNKDPAAWKIMKKYNINDVILLEEVYNKFLPWITNHPNKGLYQEESRVCPKCGSAHYQSRGWSYTNAGKYKRYQCLGCRGWFRDAGVTKNKGPTSKERFTNVCS